MKNYCFFFLLRGGPHDGMILEFAGSGESDSVNLILAGGVKIQFDGDIYLITHFDKDEMRGIGVWQSERVLTE